MIHKTLTELCPNCGGKVEEYKYGVSSPCGQYYQFYYMIQCHECGNASCPHDNEDDALHEFYVEMDTRPIKEVKVKKWAMFHLLEDGAEIQVHIDKIRYVMKGTGEKRTQDGHVNYRHPCTWIHFDDEDFISVEEPYEKVMELLCQSGN